MNKIKLDFGELKESEVRHDGKTIHVRPYMSLEEQLVLIDGYLNNYFLMDQKYIPYLKYDYFGAELALKLAIIDQFTDIQVFGDDDKVCIDMARVISDDLYDKICDVIAGYYVFRQNLDRAVQDMKEQLALDVSVGKVLDTALTKIMDILNDMANMDVEKLKEAAGEIAKSLEQSPIADVFKQAEQEAAKPKKTRKKSNV